MNEEEEKIQEQFDYHLQKGQGFMEFIDERFREVSKDATLEEMAEWSFGSLEECLKEWKTTK